MAVLNPADTYTFRKTAPAVLLIVFALGTLIYGHTLSAPFYFDDLESIVENPHIRMTRLTWPQLQEIGRDQPVSRLLPLLTFAVNHYFTGYQSDGFRLVNIFIHIINGWLVFCVAWQTSRLSGQRPFFLSLVAALLWLTLPVHTQSVTYIVQRMNSLATMFYLLSFICYIQARRLRRPDSAGKRVPFFWFSGCILAGLCGLLCKETSATLPLFIFLYDWYFLQGPDRSRLKKHRLGALLAVALCMVIAFFYLGGHPAERISGSYINKPFTPAQRLLTQPRVIVYYLSLLTFGHSGRLMLEYDFPVSNTLTDPEANLPAIAALAALIILAALASRKKPLVSFAVVWLLGSLFIESSVIGLALIFEHRTYLPSIFPVMAVAACLTNRIRPASAAAVVIGAIIVCNAWWTYQRNITWQDRISFWSDGCAKSPHLIRPRNDYGLSLAEAGALEKARLEYEKALALPSGEKAPVYNNLGTLFYRTGEIDKAGEQFLKAIEAQPTFAKAYMNLGIIKTENGDYAEAIRLLETAVNLDPNASESQNALGMAYYRSGRTEDAIRHCRRAGRLDPENANAANNLGAILLGIGRAEDALPHLERAVRLSPEHIEANINIAIAYSRLNNPVMAVFHFFRAVFLDPENPAARTELGLFLLQEAKYADARIQLEKALDLQPGLLKARLGLADALEEQDLRDEAIRQYQKILTDHPNNVTAGNRLQTLLEKNDDRN